MIESKEKIVVGRRSAGYALSLWRSNVTDAELTGYLLNTKKDVDSEMVVCLVHWLRSIVKDLPDRTLSAWANPGTPRKPFFNWFYQTKKQEAFRDFAYHWLKKQEEELAAMSSSSSYGEPVDFGGLSDLAEISVDEFTALASAPSVNPDGYTKGAGLTSEAVPAGVDWDSVPF